MTHEFELLSGSSSLKAYHRHDTESEWAQVTEKTTDDLFNAVEAVRFDYAAKRAYVSLAFGADNANIYVRLTDATDTLINARWLGMTEHYDNRDLAITLTLDEWDDADTEFSCGLTSEYGAGARTIADALATRALWASMGIVTQGRDSGGAPTWADVQTKIDLGYLEPVSHSQTHSHTPYADYTSEVSGSMDDIKTNLTMPALNTRGASEYVYVWLEPYGESDVSVLAACKAAKYLTMRSVQSNGDDFSSWNSSLSMYDRIGFSDHVGIDGSTDINALKASFDTAYTAGGIYHLFIHTADETEAGCWGVDLTPDSYFYQLLDYIAGKKDVWYVAFGHLYVYHYATERNVIWCSPA